MKYTRLTREERHTISTMKRKGDSPAIIASALGRGVPPFFEPTLMRV